MEIDIQSVFNLVLFTYVFIVHIFNNLRYKYIVKLIEALGDYTEDIDKSHKRLTRVVEDLIK